MLNYNKNDIIKIMDKKNISSGLRFHELAEESREKDKHLEALKFIEEAIFNYQKEKDYSSLTKAIQSRFLTYRHLFFLTKDQSYAILAQKDSEASLSIAEKYNLTEIIGSCHFNLGKAAMILKNSEEAIKQYEMAIKKYHGTNTERGDYYYHLGEAFFENGQKEKGKETILKGLKEIKDNASEVDPFLVHVWSSGCHLYLAKLLKKDNYQEAKEHFNKAKEIINSDEKLVIRKRQIEELSKIF